MPGTIGIILAGGSGTRLHPLTYGVSKQLLPVYDKPMIYYPLTTLVQAGIREILVITQSDNITAFRCSLDHTLLAAKFAVWYASQDIPGGIAEAFKIAHGCGWAVEGEYDQIALVLGDNLFHGGNLVERMQVAVAMPELAHVFATPVANPSSYGVAYMNGLDVEKIVEKPVNPTSNLAVTGLYFYPPSIIEVVESLMPSARGELEITDVNNAYAQRRQLKCHRLDGTAWLDMGTPTSLLQASQYVQTVQERHDTLIGSPEAAAFENGWIPLDDFRKFLTARPPVYCKQLLRLAEAKS